jgi:glycosyltransferase involved in cell wall biosynthesis
MISVCIPVYNFDINPLVESLLEEILAHSLAVEIVLIDDCSQERVKQKNKVEHNNVKYIQLTENIGRSKIRNLFLKYVTNDYLLFLDCDSFIISKDFLRSYMAQLQNKDSVICGGRVYPENRPNRSRLLRWKYGVKKESKTAVERMANPNKSFMTNNFLIKKSVLLDIQFDEQLTQYGHEDTLFGLELKKAGITITHIENPIFNGDIETNEVFLEKSEKALDNLILLCATSKHADDLTKEVSILIVAKKIQFIKPLMRFHHLLFGGMMKALLKNGLAGVMCFDIYRLGYLAVRMED